MDGILSAAQVLRRVEDARLERKASLTKPSGRQVLHTVCAFANDLHNLNGGYLVIGVEDDGTVRGVHDPDAVQRALSGLLAQIRPEYAPRITVESVDGLSVVVLRCPPGESRPYTAPKGDAGPRCPYVRVGSTTKQATGDLHRQLVEQTARIPFDDRRRDDARLSDLSSERVRAFLADIGSALADSDLAAEAIYRRLDLTRPVNGHEVPRNVALLFFALEPERWFRGARVEVASFPDGKGGDIVGERVFTGPLHVQLRQVVDHVHHLVGMRVVKHADRSEADHVHALPRDALEEAVANALYHRSYELPDPTVIDLLPDRVRVTSYPGPIGGERALDDPPPARNRRIGEILRQLRLAEARGTGIAKIRQAMAANGCPPPEYRTRDDVFIVELPLHPSFLPRPTGQPLRLGMPAPPDEVRGREALLDELVRRVQLGNVVLYGLPGVGRSSVLHALAARLGDAIVALDDHSEEGGGPPDGAARFVVVRDGPADWRGWLNVQVPPLTPDASKAWIRALAAGAGAPTERIDPFAEAVEAVAWGVPSVVSAIVAECVVRGRFEPAQVERAYAHVAEDDADPGCILVRQRAVTIGREPDRTVAHRIVEAGYDGLQREALESLAGADTDRVLARLCRTGAFVELEGRVRAEHRETQLRADDPFADDVPF